MQTMDPGRYALQQGWDSNSALEGYGAVSEPDLRAGGSYRGRRPIDEGFPGDAFYSRGHRNLPERDIYPQLGSAAAAVWSQSRRNFDEEYGFIREARRHETDNFHDADRYHGTDAFRETDRYRDDYRNVGGHHNADNYRDYGFDRPSRVGGRGSEAFNDDNYEYRRRASRHNRENSHERDHEFSRYTYDSDYDKDRRENSWRRRDSREWDREKSSLSRERDSSPRGRWGHSRSRSRGCDDRSRSRSPRDRSHSHSHRESSYDDSRYESSDRQKDRDHDEKRRADSAAVAPSATVVVKGLSQKTTEEDLSQILAEWGPLRHVRVIRERNSGSSRGFAFIDFPTTEAARTLMDSIGDDGLVFDGRKLFFEYSSKPTGAGGPSGHENFVKSGHFRSNMQSDWMCVMCGYVNFARRTSCFQCNEARTEDAPLADVGSTPMPSGKKGTDAGPTHVLVVRGLDEDADEEMLRYEFSKHAPVKDIRLVRDKFTHVSRGFAFVHFHSVDDATKALEATNGSKLEKNGQFLRVAYAKSIHGPGASGNPQSSSLAAAAIEAAAFSQQYDAVGWAPKEYNPDERQSASTANGGAEDQKASSAPQSGFVWDEASGYYYDAASGFYYDGNTGLYYDGNSGTWFSYDQQSQQYVPCTDQNDNKADKVENPASKSSEDTGKKKVVISAPAATITSKEKSSLPDAVQAAAAAALAAEKKEKEKSKEIKLASKSSILATKKKMNNVLTMWKQRNHEGQAARIVLDDSQTANSVDDKQSSSSISMAGLSTKGKYRSDVTVSKEITAGASAFSSSAAGRGTVNGSSTSLASQPSTDNQNTPKPVGNSLGGSVMGVIRSSGKGVVKSDTIYSGSASDSSNPVTSSVTASTIWTSSTNNVTAPVATPFRTDLSALGSYGPSATTSGKRRFSETPVQTTGSREQPQTMYRDRAAERRSLYGSSSVGDDLYNRASGDSNHEFPHRRGSSDIGAMPFPPGVGGGYVSSDVQSYEVVTADRAIDESNVGNRMLRNMGWQEGSGLGKDGSGITEPVQALGMEDRAGLGRHPRKVDPTLEVQAGDSYRTLIQKKAIARFREMS